MLLVKTTFDGETYEYTIAEEVPYRNEYMHPLTHHVHYEISIPIRADSVKELKTLLKEMLKACDKPHKTLHPARTIQAKLT